MYGVMQSAAPRCYNYVEAPEKSQTGRSEGSFRLSDWVALGCEILCGRLRF